VTFDLPGLVRHLGRLLGATGALCAAVALVTYLASGGGLPADRHEDAVIVLGTLAAVQLVLWFGLTVWADLADRDAREQS
jgi:hypothetical protein